jgi:hypothetical protein
VKDWTAWHSAYDDPSSSLARRLAVVRKRVAQALERARDRTRLRVVSLCAGDGRDLLPVLADAPSLIADVVLVERHPVLAAAARGSVAQLALDHVTVITGDAGATARYRSALPADLLLLCGIFGNISEQDIRATVAATPAMLNAGGTVIWTRGRTDADLRPAIRKWFEDAGLTEVGFDSEPEGFGVGVAVNPHGVVPSVALAARLFTFDR